MKRNKLEAVIRALVALRNAATDEQALEAIDIYPEWRSETSYRSDGEHIDRVAYLGNLYRCEQAHTSQNGWTPDITPALWTRVSIEEWPEWVQPTGAQDAYREGAKVSYGGKHWISTIDYNTYAPGVYGWREAT